MNLIRCLIVMILCRSPWWSSVVRRCLVTEVGFTGFVSDLGRSVMAEEHLKPLNRFEHWLLKPSIKQEQMRRRLAFQQAVYEVTGEII